LNVTLNTAGLAVQAQPSELRRAAAWLHGEAGARGVPEQDIARLDLCLHEALANIIDHSGLAAEAPVQLLLQVDAGSATLTLADAGRPYDPTLAAVPARPATLADIVPGGLGVLMRSQSDQLDYHHDDGHNHLHITVRWSAA
jgi:anti-sigma regulatory factor (Ser/Thr protein kinase)